MKSRLSLVVLVWFLSGAVGPKAHAFDYDSIAPHPRLVFTQDMETAVRHTIETSQSVAAVHARIMAYADETLSEPTAYYKKDGKRLLAVSRLVLRRITHLAYAYRMTGDERYALRALQEMKAACRFADWNPSHFLDTAEMTMAMALGYDWLYDWLSTADRAMIAQAILTHGLQAADHTKLDHTNNWNSVCNAGITYGALALYEEMPDVARHHIERAVSVNPNCLRVYGPDGGYPEGYNYWSYGTSFEVMLLEGLRTALGNDAGLSAYDGFLQSARFVQYMSTPLEQCFNFYDTTNGMQCNTMLFWFARQLQDPTLLYLEMQHIADPGMTFEEDNRLLPMLPILASQTDLTQVTAPTSSFWWCRGTTPVFIYRSGWDSREDTYFAIKGGTASSSHAHMDAGTFVFERNGERWATDLGSQDYLSLESRGVDLWNMRQESQRWDVFRYNNEAHNTISVNGLRSRVNGKAEITHTYQSPKRKGAVVDMTHVYEGQLRSAIRTACLDAHDNLTITDRLQVADSAAIIAWHMVTPAQATIVDDHTILLTQHGKTMRLQVKHPTRDVEMKVWSNQPTHDYDAPNSGTMRVGFEVHAQAGQTLTLTTLISIVH